MFKKVLMGMVVLVVISSGDVVYAKKPGCEMGDAVFRALAWYHGGTWFGHAGIYFNSDSAGGGYDPKLEVPQITNSDMRHSVIHAPGGNPPRNLCIDSFDVFLDNKWYCGAGNSGTLNAEDRRNIIKFAYNEIDAKYGKTGIPGDEIKLPREEDPTGEGSFRCDGLVEYCYEKVGVDYFSVKEEKECWSKILDMEYAYGVLPKFYPIAIAKKMQQAVVELPQIT